MSRLAWAFLERILPRIASAIVMLVFAAVTSPSTVGTYAWMVIALTGIQAIFDAAIRQVAVGAVHTGAGMRFLRRYQVTFAISGPLLMASALGAVAAASDDPPLTFASLLPIVFAPVFISLSTVALARLQSASMWRGIASVQSVAVLVSLCITLPIVLLLPSALGPSLQATLAEALNAALLILLARRAAGRPALLSEGTSPRPDFLAASWFAGLGWAQSQADRIIVGLVGGDRVLGLYTFSWSLSRNVGDALSYASVNVLRPRLLDGKQRTSREVEAIFRDSLTRAVALLAGVVVTTFVGATYVLPLILDDRWAPVFTAVPVMSLCSIPLVTAWSLTPVLVNLGKLKSGLWGKAFGVLAAIPIGYLATIDLTIAAWAALVRELIVTVSLMFPARQDISIRAYLPAGLALSTLATLLGVYQFLVA